MWDDTEVARRWLWLCSLRKQNDGLPEEPTRAEIDSIRNDPERLAEIRSRLSNISWWIRLLCQRIATWANVDFLITIEQVFHEQASCRSGVSAHRFHS